MSEHRRKPPQSRGRRAAAPSGRRAAPPPPREESGGSGHRREAAANAAEGAGRRAARRRPEPPPKKRFIDYPRAQHTGARRWLPSWKQVLGSAIIFMGMLVGLIGLAYAMVDIPDVNKTAESQKNVYYWDDGTEMVVAGGGDYNRQIIPFTEIPTDMVDSVVAAENATFWDDPGVDLKGIARAVVNMAQGGDTQSGSTITQQYVKNMYLDQSQTLSRKFKELLISVKVSSDVPKEEIMAGYLNTSYFGRGAYGIQAAARAYYDKDAKDLNANECAYLTTLLKGADLYDTSGGTGGAERAPANIERATNQWVTVLDRRVAVGNMDASERNEYTEFPMPQELKPATNLAGQIGYLKELADNYLINNDDIDVDADKLAMGGYSIHTTFNKEMVNQMEEAVQQVIDDNLDPENREEDEHVQFGGAAVVPGDGAVVAIYGGHNAVEHYLNNANNAGAQVGSTFKPFVLAAAMRDGVRDPQKPADQPAKDRTPISPESIYSSEDMLQIKDYKGDVWYGEDPETGELDDWEQANFEGGEEGDITIRRAMEISSNSPFVQLGMDVGPATVKEAAMDAGLLEGTLGPADDSVPSFALGVSTPGPIRMATAYATFAASGEQADPYFVTHAEREGVSVYEHETKAERHFDANIADNVTDVLVNVVTGEQGSGRKVQALGRPVAAKTGTTDGNNSAWFVGYTKQLSTAIGMWRFPDSEDIDPADRKFLSMRGTAGMEKITGGSLPADIWLGFMKEATKDDPVEDFPKPGKIGEVHRGVGTEPELPDPPPVEETEEEDEPEVDETEEPETDPEPDPPADPDPDPTDSCQPGDQNCASGGGSQGNDGGGNGLPGGGNAGNNEGGSGTDSGADAGADAGAEGGSGESDSSGDSDSGTPGWWSGGTG
ncbi:transglycosylase domain-containing protein [Streptomyces xiamenensis]|uniref:transglycosylase domain-containing protein n=1 Tax=Streptomyces xiamenensis TaxID=408015 RepID=UPI0036F0886C